MTYQKKNAISVLLPIKHWLCMYMCFLWNGSLDLEIPSINMKYIYTDHVSNLTYYTICKCQNII